MSVLTIYTNNFPYGKAETFLETEILILSLHFEKIYIVPFRKEEGIRILPRNVKVLSTVQDKKWGSLKIYLTGILSFNLILDIPELKKELKGISVFKAIRYLGFAILTKSRLSKLIPQESSVHYSYWLNFNAFSLALLKMEGKIKILISRAHGFDLYEERGERSLLFIKGATLKNLDKLYLISEHGWNYISDKYPEYSDKYFLSRLGTSDPECVNPLPDGGCLTLVSCSGINPNKRLFLILEALILIRSRYPSFHIKWYHLGSGKDIVKYIEKAEELVENSFVECHFPGQLTTYEIYNFYKTVPVDLFVNVSESEGIPVSIMEAQSFSIPAVATNAGGTSELVNDENGLLISQNPSPDELADIFYNVYEQRKGWQKKRSLSRIFWENNYNAENNYTAFSRDLSSFLDSVKIY